MRVAIVHEEVAAAAGPDAQDTLVQVAAVRAGLLAGGHAVVELPFGLDLAANRAALLAAAPVVVFNLVESLAGTGRLIHVAPALFDSLGLPFTGNSTAAVFLTSNKLLGKQWLAAAGLPTPAWHVPGSGAGGRRPPSPGQRVILKSVWEHASIGIDDSSILSFADLAELDAVAAPRQAELGGDAFFETFVEGREFNLSVLDGATGPELLPAAEILFENFGDRPRIVGYRAKWEETAFEFTHTPRTFSMSPADQPLLVRLGELALACWRQFDLRGYARVDFRVDAAGQPFVLEINTNPCLAPDAGFAAALELAGIPFVQAIERILQAAIRSRQP